MRRTFGVRLSAVSSKKTRQPYRETEHHILIEALAGRGNVAEALRAYEWLRVLLREELGIAPDPSLQAVHRRLLLQSADG